MTWDNILNEEPQHREGQIKERKAKHIKRFVNVYVTDLDWESWGPMQPTAGQ